MRYEMRVPTNWTTPGVPSIETDAFAAMLATRAAEELDEDEQEAVGFGCDFEPSDTWDAVIDTIIEAAAALVRGKENEEESISIDSVGGVSVVDGFWPETDIPVRIRLDWRTKLSGYDGISQFVPEIDTMVYCPAAQSSALHRAAETYIEAHTNFDD